MLRFYIALWASKFFLFIYRLTGRSRNDRPGLLALKICPDFLKRIGKPKLVVAVTGTNGKTTVASLVSNILKSDNKKVSYNDWGANMFPGHAVCLMNSVNIFNRPKKDAAVLELDELTADISLPYINPNYLIVTNIARDSIRRNAHTEHIFNHLDKGIRNASNIIAIMNADDPISSFLYDNGSSLYYSIKGTKNEPFITNIDDFNICPNCGSKPVYEYRNYRHIGKFRCEKCGLKSKDSDYSAEVDYDNHNLIINNDKYKMFSNAIFNNYNLVAIVALFKHMGYDTMKLQEYVSKLVMPSNREKEEIVNGKRIIRQVAKGQNGSSCSTVFSYITSIETKKQVILLVDEVFGDSNKVETITWVYETDYELLNNDNISRIIVVGERYLDYKLRLKLAGIDESKFYCVRKEEEALQYIDFNDNNDLYILYDVDSVSRAASLSEHIKENILKGEIK